MFDLPPLLDLRYRIQVISLGGWDDGMPSEGCGGLELVEVGWVVVIGAGRLLGKGAYVLVRASTARQIYVIGEEISVPC